MLIVCVTVQLFASFAFTVYVPGHKLEITAVFDVVNGGGPVHVNVIAPVPPVACAVAEPLHALKHTTLVLVSVKVIAGGEVML